MSHSRVECICHVETDTFSLLGSSRYVFISKVG